jgi:hypothetical protein
MESILTPGITLTRIYTSANQNLTWQIRLVGWQHQATKLTFSLIDIFNKTQLLPRNAQKKSDVSHTTGG